MRQSLGLDYLPLGQSIGSKCMNRCDHSQTPVIIDPLAGSHEVLEPECEVRSNMHTYVQIQTFSLHESHTCQD